MNNEQHIDDMEYQAWLDEHRIGMLDEHDMRELAERWAFEMDDGELHCSRRSSLESRNPHYD